MLGTLSLAALIVLVTIVVSLCLCSVAEWVVHAKLFHNQAQPVFYKGHRKHHDHTPDAPDDPIDRSNYALAAGAIAVALFAATAGYLLSHFILVFIPAAIVAGLYFGFLKEVHHRLHERTGIWLDTTRLFRYLRRHHAGHHHHEDRNFCILFPFADVLLGTLYVRKRSRVTP